jgi:hypothetical protein
MTTPRHEVNAVIARVLGLPDVAKFEVFKALQDDLSATVLNDPKTRLIEKRNETLEALTRVAEHLGLPAGEPPTTKQFDATAKELGLPWSSSAVGRLWGHWSLAVEVFKGQRGDTVKGIRQKAGLPNRPRKKSADYLNDIRTWLESSPNDFSRKAYEAFALDYNLRAAWEDALATGVAISRNLTLHWKNVVTVAKGDLTHEEASEQELAEILPAHGKDGLIGIPGIARFLRMPATTVESRAEEDRHFPVPVAHIQGNRAWLYEDIKLYKRGLAPPSRAEDEKQVLYMDASELIARLGISQNTLHGRIHAKRWGLVPQPEGTIAKGYCYWKREKIESWFKAKAVIEP